MLLSPPYPTRRWASWTSQISKLKTSQNRIQFAFISVSYCLRFVCLPNCSSNFQCHLFDFSLFAYRIITHIIFVVVCCICVSNLFNCKVCGYCDDCCDCFNSWSTCAFFWNPLTIDGGSNPVQFWLRVSLEVPPVLVGDSEISQNTEYSLKMAPILLSLFLNIHHALWF